MGPRAITGYVAHAALAAYWLWIVASTAPQLRKGCRDRRIRARLLAIKTAGFLLTAVVVGVVHYWATEMWHIAACLALATGLGVLLHRAYRRFAAAPRHRLTVAHRARTLDLLPRRRSGSTAAHVRRAAAAGSAAP